MDHPSRNDDELLRRVVEGCARATGEEFFRALIRSLCEALHVSHGLVAAVTPARDQARTLALWASERFLDNVVYDLEGTPCKDVISGALCHHPQDVQTRYPGDPMLVKLRAESYLGVPLEDAAGRVIGHIAIMDARPMAEELRHFSIFRIFAARAAAELERVQLHHELVESERRWRDLFEEAPIGYVYEDTQTRFVTANRAAQRILGIRPEEVATTVGMSLVAPTQEAQERVHDSLAAEQAGQEKPYITLELRRKDTGQPVWIHRHSRPEPDGKHTRTMLVDITDQVLAERERNRLQHQNAYLREEIESGHPFDEMVGRSAGLRAVLTRVQHVAPTDATVLIEGETGTGKELVARAVHANSRRKEKPFIKVNCAALPAGLIESELFGHEKGAFTGALTKRLGRFALADGGTIFLDEIGEVPLDLQVRLLRVLQEREFEAVGSSKTLRVDVRVIAATNRDLKKAVVANQFRADLYYRLNVFPIAVPPLRDRRDDIAVLAPYFAARFAAKVGKRAHHIQEDALQRLREYPWPGNVRELENVIERAVILSPEGSLVIDPGVLRTDSQPRIEAAAGAAHGPLTAAEVERTHILKMLAAAGWRVEGDQGAARMLGLQASTLRSRMKKLGIHRQPGD